MVIQPAMLACRLASSVVSSDDIPIHHIVDENCNWVGEKHADVPMAWKVVDGAGNDLGMFHPAFEMISEDDDLIEVQPAFEDTAEADVVPRQEPTQAFRDETFVFDLLEFQRGRAAKNQGRGELVRPPDPEETAGAEGVSECGEAETQETEAQETGGLLPPVWLGDRYAAEDENYLLPRMQLVEQRGTSDRRGWFTSAERSALDHKMEFERCAFGGAAISNRSKLSPIST